MTKFPYLLLCLSCFIISGKTDNGFSVAAKINGIADGTQVMLQNRTTGEYLDSAVVLNGEFGFKGKLPDDEPEELRIISGLKELKEGILFYTDLLIGNENVQVDAELSGLPYNVNTSGSPSQEESEQYYKQVLKWNITMDSLKNYAKSLNNTTEKALADQQVKKIKDSFETWKVNFLKENFNSYIGLLLYNYRKDFPADTLKKLFNAIPRKLKQSKYGKSVALQLKYPKLQRGDTYYDFESFNVNGERFKLSDIKSKYLLLQFAGTGCYGSGLSVNNMAKIYEKYKDSVSFVSYFIDDQRNTWINTSKKSKITWASLWAAGGKYSEPFNRYSVTGTPTFYLISPDKKVLSTWFGYEDGIIEKEIIKATRSK